MRERRLRGSERGAPSNGRPYRDTTSGNITDDVITANFPSIRLSLPLTAAQGSEKKSIKISSNQWYSILAR